MILEKEGENGENLQMILEKVGAVKERSSVVESSRKRPF
jgi:hypothetical protein